MSVGRFAWKTFNTIVGVVALVVSLTVLLLCARTVMDMGGSCASGGPYVVARPCPEGVAWMTPVSILLGLVSVGWMIAWDHGLPGPKWALLAWPALFLSLGWNFWEYGLDSPAGGGEAGWIVCGVVFVLMGGLPLLAFKSRDARRATFWSDAPPSTEGREILRPSARTVIRTVTPTFPRRAGGPPPASTSPPPPPFSPTGGDASTEMVGELQRLAAMHRAGELTDEEFAIAKQRVLRA
jgi:hypothetical protein